MNYFSKTITHCSYLSLAGASYGVSKTKEIKIKGNNPEL
jgi:hypothetical protein